MLQTLLADTNFVIDFLNDTINFEEITEYYTIRISAITIMELYGLAGISHSEEKKINEAKILMTVINIDTKIAMRAGHLARTRPSRSRKPDLLIAATALELDIPLLTHNLKDFKTIPNLRVQSL